MTIEGAMKWREAEVIASEPRVHDALQIFSHDSTSDNAAGLICEVLDHIEPIPMVLFCPACGQQHIDEPEKCPDEGCDHYGTPHSHPGMWLNPPHRSHECQFCKYTWRPSDLCTTGVLKVETQGQNDSPAPHELAKSLADHARERQRLLNAHSVSIKIDSSVTPENIEKIKAAFKTVHIKHDDMRMEILPNADEIKLLTKKAADVGAAYEREVQRNAQHARAIRVADILRDLRNTVMEISFFRMRKTDVLAEIDAARMQVTRINEGTER